MISGNRWKTDIFINLPKLEKTDTFPFACHSGLACWRKCCSNVTLFLTPLDVLRMKQRLGISSEEFLRKYTTPHIRDNFGLPMVMLKMLENEEKHCPFLNEKGCGIYEDRPFGCRTYPLGQATCEKTSKPQVLEDNYFNVKEDFCLGHGEPKQWTVEEWYRDQGLDVYNELNRAFQEISLDANLWKDRDIDPKKLDMFYMASYDLDRFRRFVFESSFLDTFEVESETVEKIRTDDGDLMKFAFRWLKFFILGEGTIKPKENSTRYEKMRAYGEESKRKRGEATGSI